MRGKINFIKKLTAIFLALIMMCSVIPDNGLVYTVSAEEGEVPVEAEPIAEEPADQGTQEEPSTNESSENVEQPGNQSENEASQGNTSSGNENVPENTKEENKEGESGEGNCGDMRLIGQVVNPRVYTVGNDAVRLILLHEFSNGFMQGYCTFAYIGHGGRASGGGQ